MTIEQLKSYRSDRTLKSLTDNAEEHEQLERRCSEVIKFCDSIPRDKSEIRTIVTMRYISGKYPKSWQSIATYIGKSSENTPKNKLKKYFTDCGFCGLDDL